MTPDWVRRAVFYHVYPLGLFGAQPRNDFASPPARHLQGRGPASPYAGWFDGLTFGRSSPHGDPFSYRGWNGHYDLVKLDVCNPAVQEHLFDAIRDWVESFGIDGLRLDAADCLDLEFLRAL